MYSEAPRTFMLKSLTMQKELHWYRLRLLKRMLRKKQRMAETRKPQGKLVKWWLKKLWKKASRTLFSTEADTFTMAVSGNWRKVQEKPDLNFRQRRLGYARRKI